MSGLHLETEVTRILGNFLPGRTQARALMERITLPTDAARRFKSVFFSPDNRGVFAVLMALGRRDIVPCKLAVLWSRKVAKKLQSLSALSLDKCGQK